MQMGPSGYEPVPGLLAKQLSQVNELHDATMPAYEIVELDRLLDSSNMVPDDWTKIAQCIAEHYNIFDGFVVVHGTDTMAYATSALSFMLRGLSKPIIFTGSQIPLGLRRNDARENLITALILASEYSISEVCLYFGGKLLRGCRSSKISTHSFSAFDSPNFPPLGEVATDIEVYSNRLKPLSSEHEFHFLPIQTQRVATFRLFPGVSSAVLENLLRHPLQALVLESFGVGNGPTTPDFLRVLREATERGIVLVNCSQCGQGCVEMNSYATGKLLCDCGVVSGRDMTIEAAITKLMFLLTRQLSCDEVRRQILVNLAGELTE